MRPGRLADFATYFVEERGVNGGPFEGKLTILVTALKNQIQLDIIKQVTDGYMRSADKPQP